MSAGRAPSPGDLCGCAACVSAPQSDEERAQRLVNERVHMAWAMSEPITSGKLFWLAKHFEVAATCLALTELLQPVEEQKAEDPDEPEKDLVH